MSNPVKTITRSLIVFCLLAGVGVVYRHFQKPAVEVKGSLSQVKKKVTKRKIPQAGLPPIEEEIIEDEKLDAFVSAKIQAPKNHLLGLTLSYDEGIKYNLIFGKRITGDLYGVGKVTTDFNLSKAEAGIIYVF